MVVCDHQAEELSLSDDYETDIKKTKGPELVGCQEVLFHKCPGMRTGTNESGVPASSGIVRAPVTGQPLRDGPSYCSC